MGIEFGSKNEERKETVLKLLEYNIQAEHEAINHYFGFKGTCEALHVDSNILSIIDEILKDEEDHLNKLLALRKQMFGY